MEKSSLQLNVNSGNKSPELVEAVRTLECEYFGHSSIDL